MGYGSGDLAGNVVYAFLSSFVMLYLTNTVGLNPGIIGTLIMVSKLFDGISDMFFGTMIDKTKSKLGKARPWMLYAYIGCAVTLVANFAIPDSLGTTAQYAWFFVAYTLLNAVFLLQIILHMHHWLHFVQKQQRTCRDGIMAFYLCIFNKLAYSVCYSSVCKSSRRWSSCLENSCCSICYHWSDCKYNFRIFNQGASRRRIKSRERLHRRKV